MQSDGQFTFEHVRNFRAAITTAVEVTHARTHAHTHTHTQTRLTALGPGLPG